MAAEFVTRWLEEKKPSAQVTHLGVDDDEVHVWDLEFPDRDHVFRIGIHDAVVEDEGLLAERLMELDAQGWLDDAGEKDLWVLVASMDISEGLSPLGKSKPVRADRTRTRQTRGPG